MPSKYFLENATPEDKSEKKLPKTESKPALRQRPEAIVDPKAGEKLKAVAAALGVAPDDLQAIKQAFEALLQPLTASRLSAYRDMSLREMQMCKELKVEPGQYVALRNSKRR